MQRLLLAGILVLAAAPVLAAPANAAVRKGPAGTDVLHAAGDACPRARTARRSGSAS